MLYAHTAEGEGKEARQPLAEHLQNVASLSAGFADKFGAPQLGHLIGLVHDVGKGSAEFQSVSRAVLAGLTTLRPAQSCLRSAMAHGASSSPTPSRATTVGCPMG